MKVARYWGPVIVWMVIIFYLSSREHVQVSPQYIVNFIFFKFLHILEYFIMYVLLFRAYLHSSFQTKRERIYIFVFILVVLYALSDEVHQAFVPTREGKLRDVIIDAVGAGGAWIWLKQLLPNWPMKLRLLALKLEVLS